MSNGRLFVFEGPDGIGKTELSNRLHEHLMSRGIPCESFSFPGKDEGSLGRIVYELHHRSARLAVKSINPTSLQLLHIAAHIDAIESRILPLLASGKTLVLDRFWWSTLAYGPTFGARPESIEAMVAVERQHWAQVIPTCMFLVFRTSPAREGESQGRHRQLSAVYESLVMKYGGSWPIIRISTNATVEQSFRQISQEVERFIKNR